MWNEFGFLPVKAVTENDSRQGEGCSFEMWTLLSDRAFKDVCDPVDEGTFKSPVTGFRGGDKPSGTAAYKSKKNRCQNDGLCSETHASSSLPPSLFSFLAPSK